MFESGRSQIVIYAVIAAVLLLVGFNSIRGEPGSAGRGAASFGSADGGGGPGTNADAGGEPGSGLSVTASETRLVVDVSGGVRDPGVYRLAPGTRVVDAIRIAGGTLPRAMPGAINRAAKLADGQQVVVPVMAAAGAERPGTGDAGVAIASAADAPISLGSATPEQLEEIDGIGPVTASQIIEFRDSQGGLGSVDELDQVSGIGPVTMEALRSALQP